jgi:hypothetical protein
MDSYILEVEVVDDDSYSAALWIGHRAISLLRSITSQEGVWNAAAKASIVEVAIAVKRQVETDDPLTSEMPVGFARV